MDKEKAKLMMRELLGAWEINLGSMYLAVIDGKIDMLSDDKLEKSCQIMKKYF